MATAYDFAFTALDGGPLSLRAYSGKAMLVVNVASACGFTPQYRELQSLWEAKGKAGLVVIGAPCNDFGQQERQSEGEIAAFCAASYRVTFPMTAKIEIVGANRHPFYQWIATELGAEALPRWNFHKYLIGRDGRIAETFPSNVSPLGTAVLGGVARALAGPG